MNKSWFAFLFFTTSTDFVVMVNIMSTHIHISSPIWGISWETNPVMVLRYYSCSCRFLLRDLSCVDLNWAVIPPFHSRCRYSPVYVIYFHSSLLFRKIKGCFVQLLVVPGWSNTTWLLLCFYGHIGWICDRTKDHFSLWQEHFHDGHPSDVLGFLFSLAGRGWRRELFISRGDEARFCNWQCSEGFQTGFKPPVGSKSPCGFHGEPQTLLWHQSQQRGFNCGRQDRQRVAMWREAVMCNKTRSCLGESFRTASLQPPCSWY